jgi:O-antigen/teichoic acid export membrane protein
MSTTQRLHQLGEGVTLKTAGTVFQVAVGLGISILLNRVYGKEQYGLLVLVYAVTALAFATCDFGAKVTLLRYVPRLLAEGDEPGAARLFAAALLVQLAGIVLFAAAVLGLASPIAIGIYGQPALAPLIATGTVYIAAFALQDFTIATFQALQDWRHEGALTLIFGAGQVAMVILVGVVLKFGIGWVLIGHSVACGVMVMAGLLWLPGSFRRALRPSGLLRTGEGLRTVSRFGLPLTFQGVYRYGASWVDKLVLGPFITPGALAMYYIAASFLNALVSLFKVLSTVFAPHVASLAAESAGTVRRQFGLMFRWFTQTAVLAALVAFAAVEVVVPIVYGPSYTSVIWLTRALMIIFVLRMARDPAGLFVTNLQGNVKLTFIAGTVLNVSTLVATAALVPVFRTSGAIAAIALSHVAHWTTLLVLDPALRRIIPVRTFAVAAALLVVLGALYVTAIGLGVPGLAAAAMLAPLYAIGLKVAGEISAADVQIAVELIRANRNAATRAARRMRLARNHF